MLREVLFAFLLVVGFACAYQFYDEHSNDEYEGIGNNESGSQQSPDKPSSECVDKPCEFPPFEVMGTNWMFDFLVKREGENGLVFEGRPAEDQVFFLYDEIREVVELHSLLFEYSAGGVIRLHLRFQSMNSPKKWTVISRAFGPPPSDSTDLKEQAKKNAVFPHSPNQDQVYFMSFNHGTYAARISLDVKWVVDVLTFKPPKFDHSPTGKPWEKIYRAAPVIYQFVLGTLRGVRDAIRNPPIDVTKYVVDVTKDIK